MNLKTKNIRLNIILLFTIHYLLFTLSGCESFRKKFVRQKKRKKEVRVVTQIKDYDALYPPEVVYKQYYLFWRSTHDQIIRALYVEDGNWKKAAGSAVSATEYLEQMQALLPSQIQNELDPFIDEYKDITKRLRARNLNRAQRLKINSILKKQKKQIEQRFAIKHVQKYLVK